MVHFTDSWVHIEVKIGDFDLTKTPDTTKALRSVVVGEFRGDYLFVTIGDGFDLEAMARLLLAETVRALAGVKPA